MGKVDGDMQADDRLHLSNAAVGFVGVMNKIAKRKIKHAILLQETGMGDATSSVVRTPMKKGARKGPFVVSFFLTFCQLKALSRPAILPHWHRFWCLPQPAESR